MNTRSWAFSGDLSTSEVIAVGVLLALSIVLLLVELRRRERLGGAIAASGILGTLMLSFAVLRPVRVTTRGSMVGPRVVVLVDQSRRLLLDNQGRTRRQRALDAVKQLQRQFSDARLSVLGFGDGKARPLDPASLKTGDSADLTADSDLAAALSGLAESPGERPRAVVVVSDGRLARPAAGADDQALRHAVGQLHVPIDTVSVAEKAPRDASIRAVHAAGAAVAHQALVLTVEIGCAGGLDCGDVPVRVRELRHGVKPALLAKGVAHVENGSAKLELSITLERAGNRVVEISIDAPDGDTIAANDRRILTFAVTRDRIRVLHVAGRPTYDVRALRMWLKSDESVDLVAFFILRTDTDDPGASDNELALIPFPVNELFTEHLPSFDAVVLQDIDAVRYRLARHLPELAHYVESGGGLIMVGGPSSFIGGGYAGTALERVLPVKLPDSARPFDTSAFVPRYTDAGRAAPALHSLRELYGDDLPEMPGSNTLGAPRKGSIVLWNHPDRKAGDQPMPVLALGEAGDGRSIALGVDGTHELAFSEMAAKAAGRGYGALWDGLLGWLMRDPRYEAARVQLVGDCITGEPTTLEVSRLPGMQGAIDLSVEKLGEDPGKPLSRHIDKPPSGSVKMKLGSLEPGGYTARVRIGAAPATRFDFSCEKGGEAWADSRPDPLRLDRIADVTGGRPVTSGSVGELPQPASTRIAAERHVSPMLPAWAWALLASLALGTHWLARRRGGLA